MKKKARLDDLLVELGLVPTRSNALALILAGEVLVNGLPAQKAGHKVALTDALTLKTKSEFVSRGGLKLKKALSVFEVPVSGLDCIDVGSSTGGFTDCLLQHGATSVTAVDVGTHQLHEQLRRDPRVKLFEQTNAKDLAVNTFPNLFDLGVMDVSFISALKIFPSLKLILKPPGRLIVLIKPQFEAGLNRIGRGGVVSDPTLHQEILEDFLKDLNSLGGQLLKLDYSPLRGHKSDNIEFLGLLELSPEGNSQFPLVSLNQIVEAAHHYFNPMPQANNIEEESKLK